MYIVYCHIHLKEMHVEAAIVHLFNPGLPWMASARALARTQPVASITCEAVHSPSDLLRASHLLLLKLTISMG